MSTEVFQIMSQKWRCTRALMGLMLVDLSGLACRASPPAVSIPPSKLRSFRKAKSTLRKVYRDHRTTAYCKCAFDEELTVDLTSCGYVPLTDSPRAHRVEWEHLVPASVLGRTRPAWTNGHKRCKSRRGRGVGRSRSHRTPQG